MEVNKIDQIYYNNINYYKLYSTNTNLTHFIELLSLYSDNTNHTEIDELINKEINTIDENGLTILKIAVIQQNVHIVKKILNNPKFVLKNIDILAIACYFRNPEIINELCNSAFIDVNTPDSINNQTPLIYAIEQNNIKLLERLLKRTDLKFNMEDGILSAFHNALFSRQYDMCNELLSHPKFNINCYYNGHDLLYYIGKYGNGYLLKKFIKHNNFKIDNFIQSMNDIFVMCVSNLQFDIDVIKILLQHVNVNYVDMYGNSALMYCCKKGILDRIQMLLDLDTIDATLINKYNSNILLETIETKNVDCINLLFRWFNTQDTKIVETIINHRNNNRENALHIAIKSNQFNVAKTLLSYKIDVNIHDSNGHTPFIKTILSGNYDLFDIMMLKDNTDINVSDYNGKTPLMYAYDFMYTKGTSVYETYSDMIRSDNSSSYFFFKLLDHPKIDINQVNNLGHSILSVILLEKYGKYYKKDNINNKLKEETIIAYDDCNNYINMSEFPNCFKTEPFYIPVVKNTLNLDSDYINIISLLLTRPDININKSDNFGYYPIMYVCEQQDKTIFDMFINNHKLDVTIKNKEGKTLLMILADLLNYNEQTITLNNIMTNQYFFDKILNHPNTNINSRNYQGNSLLLQLSQNGNHSLINKLLPLQKLDINLQNYKGDTALSLATKGKIWNIVETLVKFGAVDIKNTNGKMAIDYAIENDDKYIYINFTDKYNKKGWF